MPGRRGRGTCLASPGAKRDAATRHPSAGGRPGARARNHEREPELDIIISNASDKPIYDQIVSQMKALILTGELGEGQQLPSIRALAGDLRISVITTRSSMTCSTSSQKVTTDERPPPHTQLVEAL